MGLYASSGVLLSQSTEPANPGVGDLWYDTVNLILKGFDGSSYQTIGKLSFATAAIVSHSETIGDYSTPTKIIDATIVDTLSETGTQDLPLNDTTTRRGIKAETASSALIGTIVNKVTIALKRVSSATGTATVVIANEAGTIQATIGTYDVSTIGTSFENVVFESANAYVLAENDRIEIRYTGTATEYIVTDKCADAFDSTNTNRYLHSGTYNDTATDDMRIKAESYLYPALYDDDTTTTHEVTSANPAVYVDCGGSNVLLAGIAIYLHANTTETEIKIRISTDATFTDSENVRTITVSNLTAGAWNYIRFNLKNSRYAQIYGTTGTSVVLAISQIKYLTKTETEVLADLGVLEISSSDTSLGLDGV